MKQRITLRIFILVLATQILILKPDSIEAQNSNVLTDLFEFLRRGQADLNLEMQDNQQKLLKEYDFVIVGAGTAGCALAARLSENPNWKVLLLEAGGPETLVMDVPIVAHFLQLVDVNWNYKTEPSKNYCLGMNNNRCNWPRGKVMGGSSVLNYMMYTRGHAKDYDRWADLGNDGWSFKDLLPYFKKYEGSTVPDADADVVGRNGPVRVSYVPYRSQGAKAFVQAAQEDGLKYRDYNGHKQIGVSFLQTTTYRGIRWSSNRAYLYPLKGQRPNLHIKKLAMVTKVLIDPSTKTAQGVFFSTEGRSYKVLARREVILSAGAINTPQLLMLSGIGPAQHLREMGIKPIADLAVGFNLQDHFAPALGFSSNATSLKASLYFDIKNIHDFLHGKGVFSSPGACEAIAFWNLAHPEEDDNTWPDVEFFFLGGLMYSNPAVFRAMGITRETYNALNADVERRSADGFMIFPMILRPQSRGRIMLKSNDPFKYPLIYPNYFKDPYDLDLAIKSLMKIMSLTERPAFKAINAKVISKPIPGCEHFTFNTRDYWGCYARHITLTIYHYSGTAKMGPKNDRTAVVDPRLKVYGIKNLRVVDASIIPHLISGHPNGPVFMIAEKAADMIKEDHNYKQGTVGY